MAALLATGCPSDPKPSDAEVEIGTGTTEFVELRDGDELEVVRGPQGGFHLHVHARMRGLEPGDPSMPGLLANPATSFAAFVGGEQIDFMFPPYRLGYIDVGDDLFELPSGRILQIVDEQVPAIYGQQVRLSLSISDESGRSGSAEVTVIAVESEAGDLDAGADAN